MRQSSAARRLRPRSSSPPNLGTAALIFSFTPFVAQIGIQYWFLAGALHGVATALRRRGRVTRLAARLGGFHHARRDGPRQPRAGGVPGAARRRGAPRRAPRRRPISRPLPGLHVHMRAAVRWARTWSVRRCSRAKRRARRRALGASARVLVNGGNADAGVPRGCTTCTRPTSRRSCRRRCRTRLVGVGRSRLLPAPRARRRSRVRRSSSATASAPRRRAASATRSRRRALRVVYYGVDPAAFARSTPVERAPPRARSSASATDGRVALFIGALGDRRKGFDLLFDAWRRLSAGSRVGRRSARRRRGRRGGGVGARGPRRRASTGASASSGSAATCRRCSPPPTCSSIRSRYEAYGLGVHEAICRGLPAIVTRVGRRRGALSA